MSGTTAGWRLALRLARRDALRARGRSVLVLVMIALPVLAVTAAIALQRTSSVTPLEAVDRSLGSAQALVTVDASDLPVLQDAEAGVTTTVADADPLEPLTAEGVAAALGGAPLTPVAFSSARLETRDGVADLSTLVTDLRDPLTDGLVRPTSGRLPGSADEVVVNQAVLDRGYAVGDPLRLVGDTAPARPPVIVGVAESTELRTDPFAAGPAGSLPTGTAAPDADPAEGSGAAADYLVGGAPVTWSDVRELNALGAVVLSRAVLADPPPLSEVPAEVRGAPGGLDASTVTVLALVVTMALLEVVLLAGPAFAVGARRLQRTLALMAAAGGTPAQARRVVLAGAVVLGGVAAVLGVALGVVLALLLLPLLQRLSATWFGPFELPVLPVLAVAGLGLASAVLAAVVPAWIASRADVVAVLAGRRGDAAPSRRSPVVGLVLLGLGVAAATWGATRRGSETLIAGSALLSVLGMVLLVPVVVATVARGARRLPLSLRYAARDAARHRTRTVPAVAAVAATVAGVVALLVSTSSEARQSEETYLPALQAGLGSVFLEPGTTAADVEAAEAAVRREVPGVEVSAVQGVVDTYGGPGATTSTSTQVSDATQPGSADQGFVFLLDANGYAYGTSLVVADRLPPGLLGVSDADTTAADAALAAGQVVAFGDRDPGAAPTTGPVRFSTTSYDATSGELLEDREAVREALVVQVDPGTQGPPWAVVPPAVAAELDLAPRTTGLVLSGTTISEEQEEALQEALGALGTGETSGVQLASVRVERGYRLETEVLVLQLVLVGLGAVLMLGGTLTATFLALSDARPDLATLDAVGASPRRRRSVAASYALVVGLVGTTLGAVVGLVPGIAVSFPLTTYDGPAGRVGPYLDVPWLGIAGLVVLLPLLTAAIVAATARSRLPMTTRID